MINRLFRQEQSFNKPSQYVQQFGSLALVFASITIISNLIHGNTISALLVGGLFVAIFVILILNQSKKTTYTPFLTVFFVSVFLTIIAFAEGLKTGGYLYFFPLLFSLPFLIKKGQSNKWELAFYFSIPIICFSIVLVFCKEKSKWQSIEDDIYTTMFYTNTFAVMTLSAAFAYLSIKLERKYALALVKEKEKAEAAATAKTKFLSNMGHELRTPLNGIIGATNLIKTIQSAEENQKYLGIIKYCSEHMMGLVNDILDFNKIEQDKLELHTVKFNLYSTLKQSLLPFISRFEEKNIDLKIAIDEKLNETVLFDDVRLVQVLNNLLSNALKFTEQGHVKLQAVLEKIENNNLHLLVSVEDTGLGIATELQEKIYESFWQNYSESTRKFGGTGLGLTITRRLLQLMDSSLELKSKTGAGSTFFFRVSVPKVQTTQHHTTMLPGDASPGLNGYRIMVAEDNLINMLIAKKILEHNGASVTTCENGLLAMEALAQDDNYNLVLMDLDMPVMDGYTALDEIKKLHTHLPVLAFTAALMDNVMFDDLISRGFKDCILKPFQPPNLVAKIKKHALQEQDYELQ